MTLGQRRAFSYAMAGAFLLMATAAVAEDIPLKDWPVPSGSTGRTALVDTGNPGAFQAMTPCRLADTRGPAFPAALHPPTLAAGVSQNWAVSGNCGVPANASAVSANFTATDTQGGGFLLVWPQGGAMPTVSTLNYTAGQTVANAAIVPLSAGGQISLVAGVAGTNMIMDVNGYYTNYPNLNKQLFVYGNFNGMAAIVGFNNSNTNGSHGVGGWAGGTGNVHGVQGGVINTASAGSSGVHGYNGASTAVTYGVYGENWSTTTNTAAVYGLSHPSTGITYGVLGFTGGTGNGPSGVKGINGAEPPGCSDSTHRSDGVRGCSDGDIGVTGIAGSTGWSGIRGLQKTSGGGIAAEGEVAYVSGATAYGLYAWTGTIGCNGCVKQFVDPHPYDASKTIHYVSLEGPEAGTYFRGTTRTQDGVAIITVPDHFRFVTDEEGITVQLTAVGSPASMYVESQNLNQIVVRSDRDVTFHYLVQGIRPAYKNFEPVLEGREYVPMEAASKMPEGWTEWAKQRLIQNGTYNPDGTINMRTAERLGWTKLWAPRDRPPEAGKTSSPQQ